MKDTHEERKRRWESKSNEMNHEWKRLAEMTPEEYLAEFKGRLKIPIGHDTARPLIGQFLNQ